MSGGGCVISHCNLELAAFFGYTSSTCRVSSIKGRLVMRLQPPWMNSLCLGCALAACTLIPVAAVADDECDSGRKAPKDLTLSLSMKDGQTVFREGEIITLVARYSSSKRGKYIWNS